MHIKDELYPTPPPRPPRFSSKPQSAQPATKTAALVAAATDPSSSSSSSISGPRRSPRLGSVQPSSPAPGSSSTTEDDDDDEEEEEEDDDETVQERIERELNELERKRRTGVKFLLAEQGMRIRKSPISLFWFWVNSGWECRAPDSFLLARTHRVLSAPAASFSPSHLRFLAHLGSMGSMILCRSIPSFIRIAVCVLLPRPCP